MRHDQMVVGLDRHLHVVADDAGTAPARCHRAAVGIGEGDLLIGRGEHLLLVSLEALHLCIELRQLLPEMRRLGRKRLRRLLPVGRIELAEITRDALFQLRTASLHLALGEVPVAVVHRLELAAVDGDAWGRKQPYLAAQIHEAGADLAQPGAIVLAEIGDRLVVGREAPQEP